MSLIPKVLFQTDKKRPEKYVTDMIYSMIGSEWKYEFYGDDDVMKFFIDNPIEDLPDIIQRYKSLNKGAHRADLFRYYYLYINGGFFMDSDAMLYVNIETVVKNYSLVSVMSSHVPAAIFQGILGASPKNEIIKSALYTLYNTHANIINRASNYHTICKQLYNIIKENTFGYNIKLYEEKYVSINNGDNIIDGSTILFRHYWKSKIIPEYLHTDWNNYSKSEINEFDFTILTTYTIPNNLIRVGPNTDGGYIIADGFEYDLFISCGISNDIRFEEAFLDKHKIKCYAFDGTISSFPLHNKNMEWVKKNVGYLNTQKTTNLKEYIKDNKRIFLKMDIEGSEFNWLESISETELEKFSQIVLEVHWPFDIYRMNMLKKLNNSHYIVHIHGNNYCDRDIPKHLPSGRTYDGTVTIKNNSIRQITLPEVFEVTYVNKKLFDSSSINKKEAHFPTVLDYPNNPYAKDIAFSIPVINYKNLANLKYSWKDSQITFLVNNQMDAFGKGTYLQEDTYIFQANFGGNMHTLVFNEDYTRFVSIRKGDNDIVKGVLV